MASKSDRKPAPKRSADGAPKPVDTSTPIMAAFSHFRAELDEHHDRRERITKASRDITAQSKKIIFSLQRHRVLGAPLSGGVLSDVTARKEEIRKLLESILPDLTTSDESSPSSLNQHRYNRQISGGLQELVEAAVFEHYLTTQTLLSLSEARTALLPTPLQSTLEESDYLLGIYDATGEIMRFAITGMATGGAVPSGKSMVRAEQEVCEGESGGVAGEARRDVLADLRDLRAAMEAVDVKDRWLAGQCEKKGQVMRQSVEKVEAAVYGLIVRGKERPKGWMPDARTEPLREEVEGY